MLLIVYLWHFTYSFLCLDFYLQKIGWLGCLSVVKFSLECNGPTFISQVIIQKVLGCSIKQMNVGPKCLFSYWEHLFRLVHSKSRLYFVQAFSCPKKENVHLFSSSFPCYDRCQETSQIFPRTEQTFASARIFCGIFHTSVFGWELTLLALRGSPP